jgi:Methyltransferase domain
MPMNPAGMRAEEYSRLHELLRNAQPEKTLEVGLATGSSAVTICKFHKSSGRGSHTAIDPFQSATTAWNGEGVRQIRDAGLSDFFHLIENFDYLALPQLVADKQQFDFILIDGWHSFDYTLLDLFYADLLLREGGVLVIHDTGWPAVHRACRFLETHKPYKLLSPPVAVYHPSLIRRILGRLSTLLSGSAKRVSAFQRRTLWFSLAAYRKERARQVPDDFYNPF